MSAVLALQRYESGLWDDAVAEAETSLLLAEEAQTSIWNPTAHAVLALVAIHRGELSAAEEVLRASEPALDPPGGPRVGLDRLRLAHGLLAEARGDATRALAALEQAWRENAGAGAHGDYRELAPELVRLAVAEGRSELAGEVADAAARAAAEPASPRRGSRRCAAAACSMATRRCSRRLPRADAVARLRAAAGSFERLGAFRQVTRADSALHELGVRRGRRGPRSRP